MARGRECLRQNIDKICPKRNALIPSKIIKNPQILILLAYLPGDYCQFKVNVINKLDSLP